MHLACTINGVRVEASEEAAAALIASGSFACAEEPKPEPEDATEPEPIPAEKPKPARKGRAAAKEG